MNIDLIYTFDEINQLFAFMPLEMNQIEDEATLKEYVTESLTPEQRQELIKISCCVITDNTEDIPNLPDWFMECNGKLWFN